MTDKLLSFERYPENRYRYRRKAKPLTICIAAICDSETKNPKIIYCADKKLTGPYIEFEMGGSKFFETEQDNCFAMASGFITKAKIVVDKVNSEIIQIQKSENIDRLPIRKIVDLFRKHSRIVREECLQDKVLSVYKMTNESYHEKLKSFPIEIRFKILQEIDEFYRFFQLGFLVFGIEGEKFDNKVFPRAYIYEVDSDGDWDDHSGEGYAMIGSGKIEAEPDITRKPYSSDLPYGEAVQRVYFAKKWSDKMAKGVGPTTEVGIIVFVVNEKKKDEYFIGHSDVKENFINFLNGGLNEQEKAIEKIRKKVSRGIDSTSPFLFYSIHAEHLVKKRNLRKLDKFISRHPEYFPTKKRRKKTISAKKRSIKKKK